jgi:PAS domain S-box-containing protein
LGVDLVDIAHAGSAQFLEASGEMARLIADYDWSQTAVGAIPEWPISLRSAVGFLIRSQVPMVMLWGRDGIMIYNDGYIAFAASRHPDLLGQKVLSGGWPEVADFNANVLRVGLAGGTLAYKDQELTLHRSGAPEQVFMDLDYSPLLDDQGQPAGVLAVVIETTQRVADERERRKAHDALERLNADLEREVLKRSHVGGKTWQLTPEILGVANPDGFFESANPAWLAVLGWSPEELSRIPFLHLVHPDDRARTVGGFEALQRGEPALRFENRYRCADGQYRWLSWVAVPDNGKFYCSARDITEQMAAAAERDRIFAMSYDLFAAATFDGDLKSINPAWSRVLGRTDDFLLSTPFSEIVHPDDLATTGDVIATLQSGRPVHQFHVRLLKADGEPISFAWSAVPDADLDSGIFYTVGRDISAEKEREAELERAQEQLRQAQKMEAVGQLTGGLAHDFNNLLTGISGSLEMMGLRIAQGRSADVERYVNAAQGAAKRAAALTHRLLAFSRRQTLAPKPTDVRQLVTSMEELIRRTVGPAIELETVYAAGLWPSLIDPSQLENAVLNLCINARDAMPDGGKITIETANRWMDQRTATERGLELGQYVSLCVSDTGTGMAPDVIAKAFDPFFTTKPIGMGTGLGLSMIYGFAKQSGGSVAIYSEIDQGTMVCVYLPRHLGEADTGEDTFGSQPVPRAEDGETVLVVDDEATIRMLVTEVLTDLGYAAIDAADGAAGLKVLNSDLPIDLLVTDVGLPGGMNGRQLADAARAVRPDLKVLFITGYAENAVLSHGHLDPGMHVLTKPFAMDVLATRIRELIEA